jgi:hypothetical protein
MLLRGAQTFDAFNMNTQKNPVPSPIDSFSAEMVFDPKDTKGYTCSQATVRASRADILAYLWHVDGRCRWNDTLLETKLLEEESERCMIYVQLKKPVHTGITVERHPREFIVKACWRLEKDGSILVVGFPVEHALRPKMTPKGANEMMFSLNALGRSSSFRRSGKGGSFRQTGSKASFLQQRRRSSGALMESKFRSRGMVNLATKIVQRSSDECSITCVEDIDLGNSSVGGAVLKTILKNYRNDTFRMQTYFQELRSLEQYDEDDGKFIGQVMMMKGIHEKKIASLSTDPGETWASVRLQQITNDHRGLKEFCEKHKAFRLMMARVVYNSLRPTVAVKTRWSNLNAKEARNIGDAFSISLASNLTAYSAVDEWILRYPALRDLDSQCVWFRPMMCKIGQRCLLDAAWGLKMRLLLGAVLSTVDMFSDVNMIFYYFARGQNGEAWALLTMILASMTMQLLVVWIQHGSSPRHFFRDLFFIVFGLKAGVDAYRVGVQSEQEEHNIFSCQTELVAIKVVELVGEAIPGCILQVFMFLKYFSVDGSTSLRPVFSIMCSAATTGFVSAMISFDYDVDPARRKHEPLYYGYIPDSATGRSAVFLCMLINGGLLLLLRSTSFALLLLTRPNYVIGYIGTDMFLYLFQKMIRGDFTYWLPLSGPAAYVISLLVRILVKFLTDFTGVIQFRHPGELGGAYWSLNMVLAVIVTFGCTHFYFFLKEGDEESLPQDAVWTGIYALAGSWAVTFATFLKLMKPEFRVSFFTTLTGSHYIQNCFFECEHDAGKVDVFANHPNKWIEIRDDVKEWVQENWWTWVDQKPEWFTERVKKRFPADMIPRLGNSLRKQGTDAIFGSARRKSSIQEIKDLIASKAEDEAKSEDDRNPNMHKRRMGLASGLASAIVPVNGSVDADAVNGESAAMPFDEDDE